MNFIVINNSMAAYMEVTDDQLERIERDPLYYADTLFVRKCSLAKGIHAVICLLVSKDGCCRDIITGMQDLEDKYETVSFWNRGHKRFYQKRRNKHGIRSLD